MRQLRPPVAALRLRCIFRAMLKPSIISLRVKVPLALYEKVSTYRFEARHESRNQAALALLAAGLAALAKPPALPVSQPPARSKRVAFAGKDVRERSLDQ